jgi:hypothetical protein
MKRMRLALFVNDLLLFTYPLNRDAVNNRTFLKRDKMMNQVRNGKRIVARVRNWVVRPERRGFLKEILCKWKAQVV